MKNSKFIASVVIKMYFCTNFVAYQMEKSDRIYYRGTIIEVSYEWEGRHECHQAILAELHEEGFAFQVIQINEYHAGCVDGWIHNQFEGVLAVTYDFLFEELKKQCYSQLYDLKIINEDHSETVGELVRRMKKMGFEVSF